MTALSCLSQCEQEDERVPHGEVQEALDWEKQNAFKLAVLQNFNQELLSVPVEQNHQLEA